MRKQAAVVQSPHFIQSNRENLLGNFLFGYSRPGEGGGGGGFSGLAREGCL